MDFRGCTGEALITLPAHLASRGAAAGGMGGALHQGRQLQTGAQAGGSERRVLGWSGLGRIQPPQPAVLHPAPGRARKGRRGGWVGPVAGGGRSPGPGGEAPSKGGLTTFPAHVPRGLGGSELGGGPAKCCRGEGRLPADCRVLPGPVVSGLPGEGREWLEAPTAHPPPEALGRAG